MLRRYEAMKSNSWLFFSWILGALAYAIALPGESAEQKISDAPGMVVSKLSDCIPLPVQRLFEWPDISVLNGPLRLDPDTPAIGRQSLRSGNSRSSRARSLSVSTSHRGGRSANTRRRSTTRARVSARTVFVPHAMPENSVGCDERMPIRT